MSIRFQLLVIALTTLMLPWAGCQYARELENTLRLSQENSLQAAAGTIANALSAQPGRVLRDVADRAPFDAAQDHYLYELHNEPLLDGYREDWNLAAEPRPLPQAGLAARLLVGSTDRHLYLYLDVDDAHFSPEPGDPHPEEDRFDRVIVTLERPDGTRESYFFATGAPGPIEAQSIVRGDNGIDHAGFEPRIQGFWRLTSKGFTVEARIPRALVGSRLWIEAVDADGAHAGVGPSDAPLAGRLFRATPGLGEVLATFLSPGTRATVVDASGLKLAVAGSLPLRDDPSKPVGWYRAFIAEDISRWPLQVSQADRVDGKSVAGALAGRPTSEWLRSDPSQASLLSAAAPISVDGAIRGAVVLEQAGDQLLDLRDRALGHLFNLTLLGTALAVAIAFGVATVIGLRIDRLRVAAETAVTNDGLIRLEMPESGRHDEIGALARGFERLLGRLNEHTQYLRTLGGKLSHELRTPLTIVRSSLDNLESEGVRPDQRDYLTRAREGSMRLQSILSALGAASRVEESIKQADRVNFDLNELLRSAVAGYRIGFPRTPIELQTPHGACFMSGAPDLVLQMVDKLIENAVDFCREPGAVSVELARGASEYRIAVANDGPLIPPDGLTRLFESLYEHRSAEDDRPHFGLGLYIVRLIAEFHGGRSSAANRPDGSGAVFTVSLPLI